MRYYKDVTGFEEDYFASGDDWNGSVGNEQDVFMRGPAGAHKVVVMEGEGVVVWPPSLACCKAHLKSSIYVFRAKRVIFDSFRP